jgi:hypothetical protein
MNQNNKRSEVGAFVVSNIYFYYFFSQGTSFEG